VYYFVVVRIWYVSADVVTVQFLLLLFSLNGDGNNYQRRDGNKMNDHRKKTHHNANHEELNENNILLESDDRNT